MRFLLLATAMTFSLLHPAHPAAGELGDAVAGPATVIDGDTLEVAGRRFDLLGIDAPELNQTCQWPNKEIPCGEIALGALMDLTTAVQVLCEPRSRRARASRATRWKSRDSSLVNASRICLDAL